jgi:hypothetical protein
MQVVYISFWKCWFLVNTTQICIFDINICSEEDLFYSLQLFGIFQFIRRITYYYESLIGLFFKGIIAPFQLEYFFKNFVHTTPTSF